MNSKDFIVIALFFFAEPRRVYRFGWVWRDGQTAITWVKTDCLVRSYIDIENEN